MAKVWVLDTETKGTGATMVPLEKTLREPSDSIVVPYVARRRRPEQPEQPAPRPPRMFKVVDVMTRQTMLEDATMRETVDRLADVRSVVDVNLYVWEPDRGDWRLLTMVEKKRLWDVRGREGHDPRPS